MKVESNHLMSIELCSIEYCNEVSSKLSDEENQFKDNDYQIFKTYFFSKKITFFYFYIKVKE